MKPTVGFIGLGLMGGAVVEQLQKNDYSLVVLGNRSRGGIEAALNAGATEAETARQLAEQSDIIMLCMGTSASVESRMLGEDGVVAGVGEGKVVIDFGTSLPDSTRMLGDAVAKAAGRLLDAPLGRTPSHAREGKLNIMTSGDQAAFEQVKETLEVLGENVFYLGELGTGHTVKLINNFFGMTVANAMSEAFVVAEQAGIDKQQLYDVMSSGPLHSGMMDFVAAYALENDPSKLEFSIRNARKDVSYYASMVDKLGMPPLNSTGPRQLLGLADKNGYGEQRVCQMIDFLREVAAPE